VSAQSRGSKILPSAELTVFFFHPTETGKIFELNLPSEHKTQGSVAILDVRDDLAVAVTSSLRTPASLIIGQLRQTGSEISENEWIPLTKRRDVGLSETVVEYLSHEQNNDDKVRKYRTIWSFCKFSAMTDRVYLQEISRPFTSDRAVSQMGPFHLYCVHTEVRIALLRTTSV